MFILVYRSASLPRNAAAFESRDNGRPVLAQPRRRALAGPRRGRPGDDLLTHGHSVTIMITFPSQASLTRRVQLELGNFKMSWTRMP
jgi:hypothetical protein